jgi:hypothetical protein
LEQFAARSIRTRDPGKSRLPGSTGLEVAFQSSAGLGSGLGPTSNFVVVFAPKVSSPGECEPLFRPPRHRACPASATLARRLGVVVREGRPGWGLADDFDARHVVGSLNRLIGSGSSSSRRDLLPLFALRLPDLNVRDRVNLPRARSPVPDILDVRIVVEEPPRDADPDLTPAEIEERFIGPIGLRGLEGRRHFRDDLPAPRARRVALRELGVP